MLNDGDKDDDNNYLIKILMIGGLVESRKDVMVKSILYSYFKHERPLGADKRINTKSMIVDDFDENDNNNFKNFKKKLNNINSNNNNNKNYNNNKFKYEIKNLCDNYNNITNKVENVSNCWFRNIDGFILVYDSNDKIAYENLKYWLNEIKKNNSIIKSTSQIIIICNISANIIGINRDIDGTLSLNGKLSKSIYIKTEVDEKYKLPEITKQRHYYFDSKKIPHFIVSVETNENIKDSFQFLLDLIFSNNPIFQNFKLQDETTTTTAITTTTTTTTTSNSNNNSLNNSRGSNYSTLNCNDDDNNNNNNKNNSNNNISHSSSISSNSSSKNTIYIKSKYNKNKNKNKKDSLCSIM